MNWILKDMISFYYNSRKHSFTNGKIFRIGCQEVAISAEATLDIWKEQGFLSK